MPGLIIASFYEKCTQLLLFIHIPHVSLGLGLKEWTFSSLFRFHAWESIYFHSHPFKFKYQIFSCSISAFGYWINCFFRPFFSCHCHWGCASAEPKWSDIWLSACLGKQKGGTKSPAIPGKVLLDGKSYVKEFPGIWSSTFICVYYITLAASHCIQTNKDCYLKDTHIPKRYTKYITFVLDQSTFLLA